MLVAATQGGASLVCRPIDAEADEMELTLQCALVALVLAAALTDLSWQKVPNWLTLSGVILALALHVVSGGLGGALFSLAGLLTGFALLIGLYALGGTGAGDVKLLAAVGAFAGPARVVSIFFYTALLGGVYALGIVVYSMVAKAGWAGAVKRLRADGTSLLLSGGDVQPIRERLRTYPKLRYAIVVALGLGAEQMLGAIGL